MTAARRMPAGDRQKVENDLQDNCNEIARLR
jgi:hypothetical protein